MPTDSAAPWRRGARDTQCGSECGSGTVGHLLSCMLCHGSCKTNTSVSFHKTKDLLWIPFGLMKTGTNVGLLSGEWRDMDFQRAGSPVCVLLGVKPYLVFLHMLIAPLAC